MVRMVRSPHNWPRIFRSAGTRPSVRHSKDDSHLGKSRTARSLHSSGEDRRGSHLDRRHIDCKHTVPMSNASRRCMLGLCHRCKYRSYTCQLRCRCTHCLCHIGKGRLCSCRRWRHCRRGLFRIRSSRRNDRHLLVWSCTVDRTGLPVRKSHECEFGKCHPTCPRYNTRWDRYHRRRCMCRQCTVVRWRRARDPCHSGKSHFRNCLQREYHMPRRRRLQRRTGTRLAFGMSSRRSNRCSWWRRTRGPTFRRKYPPVLGRRSAELGRPSPSLLRRTGQP